MQGFIWYLFIAKLSEQLRKWLSREIVFTQLRNIIRCPSIQCDQILLVKIRSEETLHTANFQDESHIKFWSQHNILRGPSNPQLTLAITTIDFKFPISMVTINIKYLVTS